MKRLFASLVVLSLSAVICLGQSASTGAIVGTVRDQQGAVLSNARIVVTETATNISRNATTDSDGNYRVEALSPGEYTVQAEHQGFSTTKITNVILYVSQTLRVDARMEVGEVSAIVSVGADRLTINAETSTVGEVINQTKIENLPLNGREFIGLSTLVPGAQNQTDTKSGSFQDRYKSKGYVISFNGGRAGYNSYNVDGIESVDPHTNQLIASPPLDAIQEFRVSTNMYSAQYGRSGGAVMDIVTQSGTNQFHGSWYWYHRNKVLDALPVLFRGTRDERPNYLRNQFGGTIGGPIVKTNYFSFLAPSGYGRFSRVRLQQGFHLLLLRDRGI